MLSICVQNRQTRGLSSFLSAPFSCGETTTYMTNTDSGSGRQHWRVVKATAKRSGSKHKQRHHKHNL